MKWILFGVRLGAAIIWVGSALGQSTVAPKHVADPAHLLPRDPSAAERVETTLTAFERSSGLRVLVQLQVNSPTAEQDKVPGAFMHRLAESLGVAQRGVLVVYFAEEDDWRIWFGDETASAFVGRPGTARELTENGAIHEAKEAFLTACAAQAKAEVAALNSKPGVDPRDITAQRIRANATAIVDGLIEKLRPK
ncbi:MAG: hypothetical protein ABIZ04_25865 [Opitutus sp.]